MILFKNVVSKMIFFENVVSKMIFFKNVVSKMHVQKCCVIENENPSSESGEEILKKMQAG